MIKSLTRLTTGFVVAGGMAWGLFTSSAQAQSTLLHERSTFTTEPPDSVDTQSFQGPSTLFDKPAPQVSYGCMLSPQGVPTTYARLDTRLEDRIQTEYVPVIRWQREYFRQSSWTPRQRCLDVSQRFQAFKQADQLRYLVPGYLRSNSGTVYPVICTDTNSDRQGCEGLLITLELQENPHDILAQFLASARQGTAIVRSNGAISVDLDAYIRMVPSEQGVQPLN